VSPEKNELYSQVFTPSHENSCKLFLQRITHACTNEYRSNEGHAGRESLGSSQSSLRSIGLLKPLLMDRRDANGWMFACLMPPESVALRSEEALCGHSLAPCSSKWVTSSPRRYSSTTDHIEY
jgi:hypothetical protein